MVGFLLTTNIFFSFLFKKNRIADLSYHIDWDQKCKIVETVAAEVKQELEEKKLEL